MAVKILQNVTHDGVLLQVGEIVEGIADNICEDIVARGLAEKTDEAHTKIFTETGVEPKSAINPADTHTAPRDQSTTQAVSGQPVVPAAGVAPSGVASPAVNPTIPVEQQPTQTVVQPAAAPNGETVATPTQPTAEQIAKEMEGIQ